MATHYCPDCGEVRTAAEGVLCIECGKKAVREAFAKARGMWEPAQSAAGETEAVTWQ